MKPKIQTLFRELESQRLQVLQELARYDTALLNKRPSPEAWSVAQNILHLVMAEASSMAYMRKKLSFTSQIPKAGFQSRFRRWALNVAFALPFKFKAPKGLETFPDFTNINELSNKWASQRLELQTFIESLPDNVLEGEIWRHQVAGKMTIAQMLDFFHDHVKRHQRQIKKTLQQVAQNTQKQ
jgi:uncharacterized damage-inducible protein DinB